MFSLLLLLPLQRLEENLSLPPSLVVQFGVAWKGYKRWADVEEGDVRVVLVLDGTTGLLWCSVGRTRRTVKVVWRAGLLGPAQTPALDGLGNCAAPVFQHSDMFV